MPMVTKITEKMAKIYKKAKCVFSWPAQLKNGQIFQNWPWNGQSGNPAVDSVRDGDLTNVQHNFFLMLFFQAWQTALSKRRHEHTARNLDTMSAKWGAHFGENKIILTQDLCSKWKGRAWKYFFITLKEWRVPLKQSLTKINR